MAQARAEWDVDRRAVAALHTLVDEHGQAGLSNPDVMSGLLRDLLPDDPREATVLVQAAGAGLALVLRENLDQGIGRDAAQAIAARTLAEQTGLGADACSWAAATIAEVLLDPRAMVPQPRAEPGQHAAGPADLTAAPQSDATHPPADPVVAALGELVATHGLAGLSDAQATASLLKDLLPDSPREANILVLAAESGVATAMISQLEHGVGQDAAVSACAEMLADRTGLGAEASRWATGTVGQVITATLTGAPLGSAAATVRPATTQPETVSSAHTVSVAASAGTIGAGYQPDAAKPTIAKPPGRRPPWAIPAAAAAALVLVVGVLIFSLGGNSSAARPTGLQIAGSVTSSSIPLSWSEPGGATPGSYNILLSGTKIGSVAGDTTSYDVRGLAPATTYRFSVVAVSGSQRSAHSTILVASTATPPLSAATFTDGAYTVHFRVKSAIPGDWLFKTGKTWTDSWSFEPETGSLEYLSGMISNNAFSLTLTGAGDGVYRGTSRTVLSVCGRADKPIHDVLTFDIKISRAAPVGTIWAVTAFSGTLTETQVHYTSSGAGSYCTGGTGVAAMTGHS